MVAVCDAGGTAIPRSDFSRFLQQYLRRNLSAPLDLVSHLTADWLSRVRDAAGCGTRSLDLPATSRALRGFFADARSKSGIYAMFVKHPSHSPTDWICFYVGISKTDTRRRIVQHHCRDVEENYRDRFGHFLRRCTDVSTCFATIEGPTTRKAQLILLEHNLTAYLRPWFLALAGGVEP